MTRLSFGLICFFIAAVIAVICVGNFYSQAKTDCTAHGGHLVIGGQRHTGFTCEGGTP